MMITNSGTVEYQCEIIKPEVSKKSAGSGSKVLVNPYYGCTHRCLFCPANDGFLKKQVFEDFREKGTIYIVENILEHVSTYISRNPDARIAHLSPVSDPFQPIEEQYGLSLSIMKYCQSIDMPIAVCSKGSVSAEALSILASNPNSFAQISILSPNEEKRKFLVRGGGATVEQLLDSISHMTALGILVIARIDPIFPFITDDMQEFETLVKIVKERGVKHVVSSVADLVEGALSREEKYLDSFKPGLAEKYRALYTENINGRLHANINYRRRIFSEMLSICQSMDMAFGITWEPAPDGSSLSPEYSYGAPEHLRNL